MANVIWVCSVIIAVFFILMRTGRFTKEQMDMVFGVNFAHRGLHNADKTIPENSIAAFSKAVEQGYGIELDIQLSSDGEIVVFHDDTLERVTGVKGFVCDCTLSELLQMKLEGTSETIPLFTDVLKVIDGKVPLIVEVKMSKHNSELCKKSYEILQNYNGPYCIESFDPRIVRWFKLHAKEVLRGQLSAAPENLGKEPLALRLALGYLITNIICRPQFIAYDHHKKPILAKLAESLGAIRICWTSNDADTAARLELENEAVIFELYTPKPKYK